MLMNKRQASAWLAAVLLGFGAAVPAGAAETSYPIRPIRLVVPYAAGGGTDILARQLAKSAGESLGQPIVIDNKPGAGTVLGANEVAKAPADGYTLLWGDSATFAVNPHVYKKIAYDPVASFAPVTLTIKGALVLVASPKLGVKNVAELITYARAHPGKLSYGTPGNATPHHLAMEAFKLKAGGLSIQHTPYKGEAPALQDLVGGSIDLMFVGGRIAKPQADAGKAVVLAVAGSKRNMSMPEVPTVAESGLKGYASEYWHGIVAPARTPAAVIDKLNAAFVKAMRSPELVAWLKESGAATEWTDSTPAQMQAHIKQELKNAGVLVKSMGLSLD